MKAAFIFRVGVAMRTSLASARPKPPPLAAPSMRAMIGCGQRRMAMTISLICRWRMRPLEGPAGAAVAALLQIQPGAEVGPRPAQHHHADVMAPVEPDKEVAQGLHQGAVEGVEALGPVQGHPQGVAAGFGEEGLGHGLLYWAHAERTALRPLRPLRGHLPREEARGRRKSLLPCAKRGGGGTAGEAELTEGAQGLRLGAGSGSG